MRRVETIVLKLTAGTWRATALDQKGVFVAKGESRKRGSAYAECLVESREALR